MKALFGSLMCLVLTVSHCYALKGGPNYTKQQIRTTGNYAGLLVPSAGDNSLGIFTTTIPRTGVGRGTVAFFRNGIFYVGVVQGLADPDSGVLTAVTSATDNSAADGELSLYNANGSINGQISANPNVFSVASARLTGTAAITYATIAGFDDPKGNSDGPVAYIVSGFKQSEVQ
jgi:hypothetical protein